MTAPAGLRARIRAGETVVGTFVKTPAPHVVEILGQAGLDFAVIDQEHAPIELAALDMMALAGRAAGLPLLSRRWGASPDWIAPLLDLGLTGVMVPHVASRAMAEDVCAAVKFARGSRGISPSPRAGNYGAIGLVEYARRCDEASVVMLQIEDAAALGELDAIAACADADVLFVGPADLSQSLRVGLPSPELDRAIAQVIEACGRAGVAAGLFVGDETQIPLWEQRGVTVFVCGSDQGLLMKGARHLMADRPAGAAPAQERTS